MIKNIKQSYQIVAILAEMISKPNNFDTQCFGKGIQNGFVDRIYIRFIAKAYNEKCQVFEKVGVKEIMWALQKLGFENPRRLTNRKLGVAMKLDYELVKKLADGYGIACVPYGKKNHG